MDLEHHGEGIDDTLPIDWSNSSGQSLDSLDAGAVQAPSDLGSRKRQRTGDVAAPNPNQSVYAFPAGVTKNPSVPENAHRTLLLQQLRTSARVYILIKLYSICFIATAYFLRPFIPKNYTSIAIPSVDSFRICTRVISHVSSVQRHHCFVLLDKLVKRRKYATKAYNSATKS